MLDFLDKYNSYLSRNHLKMFHSRIFEKNKQVYQVAHNSNGFYLIYDITNSNKVLRNTDNQSIILEFLDTALLKRSVTKRFMD